MKKKYFILLLVFVLSLTLVAGCAKKDGKETTTTPTVKPVVTNAPTEVVTEEPTATPIPGPVTYTDINFNEDTEDEAPMFDGWTVLDAAGQNNSKVKKEKDVESNYYFLTGFMNVTMDEIVEEAYTFSFDAKGVSSVEVAAAFVRGYSQLLIPVSTNPQGANYYEADDSGTKFTSTTGIGFWFKANGTLTLFVKTYDKDASANIGNVFAEITTTYDGSKWNNILISDNNKGVITYSVNNAVVATVEYSELGEYADVFEGEQFYKKVSIKNAEGAVVASTESAFVYQFSEIAFGSRTGSLSLDNILVKTLEEVKE